MRLPRLAYNFWSAVGAAIATISLITFVVLMVVSFLTGITNPYVGILLYMVVPTFVTGGLLLIPLGMYVRHRRIKKGGEEAPEAWPAVDLNRPGHRRAAFVFMLGTVGFLALGAVGAYQSYHYTESNAFCGQTCHEVMHPEYIAYQNSSHARVKCVECHIGSGAGWYAKSKLSGAYQVYATLADNYPQPIPTPISNLRPAQETCEQCHWPSRFFGAQQRQFNHYMYDDSSSHWPINMLIKVGGGDPQTGQTSGIHWHMNIGAQVEYIARDERRQDIPWIRVTDKVTGRVTVYEDSDNPLDPEEVQAAIPRTMDCMDCHNRPSHKFLSPDREVDRAILTGRINPQIPEIKRVAVEAMDRDYVSNEDAQQGIANYITEYYRKNHSQIYERLRAEIDVAILSTQEAFARSIFPEMGARWSVYPDDIGHFEFPGCMRCHSERHQSADGLTLTRDCRACHSIIAQGSGDRAEVSISEDGLEFAHPEDIGEAWREMGCFECHSGTQP